MNNSNKNSRGSNLGGGPENAGGDKKTNKHYDSDDFGTDASLEDFDFKRGHTLA